MRREGGKALLNALLIADVGKDMAEYGQAAAVGGGDMQAALIHRDGFERHRFAAGIRPCDDERIKAVSKLKAYGNGLALIKQRVPGAAQNNAMPSISTGLLAVQLIRKPRLGKDKVKADKHVKVAFYIIPVFGTVRRKLRKDAVYFKLLLRGKLTQLVIGLHGRHRLHENSHAGGGHVMHESLHGPLALGLYRHDVPVGAHGDYRLLKHLGIAGRGYYFLQRVTRAGRRGAHLAADIGKLRRGAVGDLILTDDGGAYLLLKELIRAQRVKKMVDTRLADAVIGDIAAHKPRALEHARNVHKLARIQRAAEIRA